MMKMMNNHKTKLTLFLALSAGFFSYSKWRESESSTNSNLVAFKTEIEHQKRAASRLSEVGPSEELRFGRQSETDTVSYLQFIAEWDEQDYRVIERELISPLLKDFKNQNIQSLNKLTQNQEALILQGLPVAQSDFDLRQTIDGIDELNWGETSKVQGVSDVSQSLQAYINQFSSVEHVDLVGTEILSSKETRGAEGEMLTAEIKFRFDLRGFTQDQKRRQDRGHLVATVKRIKGDEWSLESLTFLQGESLLKSAPSFKNATASVGLDNIKSYLRTEAIRRGGYALSLTDMDSDGIVDILVGSMGKTQILKGQTDGRYVRMPTSVDDETLVKSAVFADFRNRGVQDLLVVRFEPSKFIKGMANEEVVIYENDGNGAFTKNPKAFKNSIDTSHYDHAMPAAVGDFSNNGLLDIYVGFPGNKDFTFFSSRDLDLRAEKRIQGLYFNQGDGSYLDILAKNNSGDFQVFNNNAGSVVFPHSALAADFNRSGHTDILVIDDMGNLSPMYRNRGDGTFDQNAQKIGLTNNQIGMSAALGDFNNNGIFDVVMTNVNFHAAERINASSLKNLGVKYTQFGTHGLRLFQGRKENGEIVYSDMTSSAGLDFSGEGLAGVEFIDYNNNGLLDIYVVNGLWSGTTDEKSQDLSSLYARAGKLAEVFIKKFAPESEAASKTSSFLMTILQTFRGDVLNPETQIADGNRPSLAGFQRNRLFRNNGNGTFTEVGFLEGVDSIADGYIVGLSDLNRDGKMDLVLRNGDPGSVDNHFAPVEVYLNQNENDMKSVILSFEGMSGNRDGVGVIVEADVNGQTLTRQLIANNGTAQSEKILHLGLAGSDRVDELRVLWPLGKTQTIKDLPAGRHHLIEPKVTRMSAAVSK